MEQDQKQVSVRKQVMTFLVLAIVTSAQETYIGSSDWNYVLIVAALLLLLGIVWERPAHDRGELDK